MQNPRNGSNFSVFDGTNQIDCLYSVIASQHEAITELRERLDKIEKLEKKE